MILTSPADWLSSNFNMKSVGWTAFLIGAYKVLRGVVMGGFYAKSLVDRAAGAEETINKMATNHLPHLQIELEKMNELLATMASTQASVLEEIRGLREDGKSERTFA